MAKTYTEQIASLDGQIAKLKARRQAAVAHRSQDERKARNHACFVLGGLLMKCFDDWRAIDFEGVASVVEGNKSVFAQHSTTTLPTSEARKRLRKWEQKQREKKTENGEVGSKNEN